MSRMNAEALIYGPDAKGMLAKQLAAFEERVGMLEWLTWEDAMDEKLVDQYPFNGTYEELKDKPFMVIHTSGTSGKDGDRDPCRWSTPMGCD